MIAIYFPVVMNKWNDKSEPKLTNDLQQQRRNEKIKSQINYLRLKKKQSHSIRKECLNFYCTLEVPKWFITVTLCDSQRSLWLYFYRNKSISFFWK